MISIALPLISQHTSAEITVSFADVPCEGAENENLNVSVMRSGARIASNLTLNMVMKLNETALTGVCGPQPSDSECMYSCILYSGKV